MITVVNAKINIGLYILRRRPDGYHDLSTLFYPVGIKSGTPYSPYPFADILEITPLPEADSHRFSFTGNRIDCPLEKNLVWKAVDIFGSCYLEKTGSPLPAYDIRLDKHIPDGAGLGGGSADASFTIMLLNRLTGEPFSEKELIEMASRLGADCPFFILNRPAIAEGVGEILRPVDFSLAGMWLVIVKPEFSISTKEAFAGIDCTRPHGQVSTPLEFPMADWKKSVFNEFEQHLFDLYPQLGAIKKMLYDGGASYAQMSGSGSAVFGLFGDEEAARKVCGEAGNTSGLYSAIIHL